MISRWQHLKDQALSLRMGGMSIRNIEKTLGIPKSTLSGWFKDIELPLSHKNNLHNNWLGALGKARLKAVLWHNKQKETRLNEANIAAQYVLNNIDFLNTNTIELAISLLYLGEGFKGNKTGMGNSNPLIVKFFVCALTKIYKVNKENIKCYLHLRADQDEENLKIYWSNLLNLPIQNFKKVSKDKRTIGKASYNNYKGVCVVHCKPVAIQRKLVYLSEKFCKKFLEMGG